MLLRATCFLGDCNPKEWPGLVEVDIPSTTLEDPVSKSAPGRGAKPGASILVEQVRSGQGQPTCPKATTNGSIHTSQSHLSPAGPAPICTCTCTCKPPSLPPPPASQRVHGGRETKWVRVSVRDNLILAHSHSIYPILPEFVSSRFLFLDSPTHSFFTGPPSKRPFGNRPVLCARALWCLIVSPGVLFSCAAQTGKQRKDRRCPSLFVEGKIAVILFRAFPSTSPPHTYTHIHTQTSSTFERCSAANLITTVPSFENSFASSSLPATAPTKTPA